MALTVAFMGTPAFAVPTLLALHEAGHRIAAVYTRPPRPGGRRGLVPTPSPVEDAARRLGLPVRSPVSLKGEDEIAALAALRPDVAVVAAYGLLLPQSILDVPRSGALNAHGSLLPRWRGAAPVQRAIEAGDEVTGVMIMRMEAGLDTGPVALTEELPIGDTETAGEVSARMARAAGPLTVRALALVEVGTLRFEDQDAITARTGREASYARKIDKGEAEIDFRRPATEVARHINAFSPFPGAWTTMAFGASPERVKLLRARAEPGSGEPGTALDGALLIACGDGAVRVLELQRAGGRGVPARDLLRGAPFPAGRHVGRP